jgi:ribose transport system ATP-binding protein
MGEIASAPAIELRGIVKAFGGVQALAGATLKVDRASVCGLVGQNGAGKSTLIKILAGLYAPDAGEISIRGQIVDRLTPQKVERLGVHFIHQDRLLPPSFTVGEALFLGREPRLRAFPAVVNRRAMRLQAADILRDYFGFALPSGALISELTAAQKQIVQITRALLHEPTTLVFDEPTAALVTREAEILFALIRRLRSEGITIIYISHYLAEIENLCDSVTVLRNGKDVAVVDPRTTPANAIASLMVARDIRDFFPKRRVAVGEPILTVEGLSSPGKFRNLSFSVRRGEIVGLTGLLGSGAKEVVRALFGLEKAKGEIKISGSQASIHLPKAAVGAGLAFVPEDRRNNGVGLRLSVLENATLASLGRFSRRGFLRRSAENAEVDRLVDLLSIRAANRNSLVGTLSGGNQQKVALAKWLSRQSSLYIMDEPTIGVDVGSKVEIYGLIGELVERGAGVLILSNDLPELLGLADRILVMYRGEISREFDAASATAAEILAQATGAAELRNVG